MRFELTITLRYLFSHKQHNAVNIISLISVGGVAVATAAMIVVLSVFNGFSDLSERQISRLAPPLQVTPVSGGVIYDADSLSTVISGVCDCRMEQIVVHQGLAAVDDRQVPVNILGVDEDFAAVSGLEDAVIDGEGLIESDSTFSYAVLSAGVAIDLGIRPGMYKFVDVYVPKRAGRINTANPAASFRMESFVPVGVYQLQQDAYDIDYILLPIESVRRMLDFSGSTATAINVYTDAPQNAQPVIAAALGDAFKVSTRLQQQEHSFKMISIEKWVSFLMLAFILVIASFNIISTISILVIDKRPNMSILSAMGATPSMMRRIFIFQGWFISIAGGVIGIVAGVLLCLAQQLFGIIKFSTSAGTNLSVDSYPVVVDPADILIVAAVIVFTGLLTGLAAVGTKKI